MDHQNKELKSIQWESYSLKIDKTESNLLDENNRLSPFN